MRNRLLPALATALLATACGSDPVIDDDPRAMTGAIVARDIHTAVSPGEPTIHVKERVTDECGVIFGMNAATVMRRRISNDSVRPATIAEFKVGTKVRVWTDVVAESCPAQGHAQVAEILP